MKTIKIIAFTVLLAGISSNVYCAAYTVTNNANEPIKMYFFILRAYLKTLST